MLDPGTCPKPTSDAELKSIIEELASEGCLNGQTSAFNAWVRSLSSRAAISLELWYVVTRIIPEFATFLVGVNNHRQFVVFLTSPVIGILLFDYLTYAYFSMVALPVDPSQISTSCPLPADLCAMMTKDTFLVSVAFWLTLQLAIVTGTWAVAEPQQPNGHTTIATTQTPYLASTLRTSVWSATRLPTPAIAMLWMRQRFWNLLRSDKFTKGKQGQQPLRYRHCQQLQGLPDTRTGAWDGV
ncbi:hypothetical protein JOM56_011300 [Amanita muscaria]